MVQFTNRDPVDAKDMFANTLRILNFMQKLQKEHCIMMSFFEVSFRVAG